MGIGEKELIKRIKDLFERTGSRDLKKVFVHVNLATMKFSKIWKEWWGSEPPPRLEVDMIPIFENWGELLIPGIEVKFFRDRTRKFVEGLQQALSFGLFGFDSLVLWHIFSGDMENREIEGMVKPTKELIEGLDLPLVYFATKLEGEKFEFFAPWKLYSSRDVDADYLLSSLRNCCSEKRNPLLRREEVEKRKRVLKVILKIPM